MITSEFLDHLENIESMFQWKLGDHAQQVPERRQRPRIRIRASFADLPGDPLFDPIGAVCYIQTGKIFDPESWIDAADAIELSLIDAGELTAAINDRTWDDRQGKRNPVRYLNQLREQLLALTRLTEVAPVLF
jgi:hypothetical protein